MTKIKIITILFLLTTFIGACTKQPESVKSEPINIDDIAESYVKLVLEVGLYNSDVVDAYYGPEEWQPAAVEDDAQFPHQQLSNRAAELNANMALVDTSNNTPLEQARHEMLAKQLTAITTKINMISGENYSFDEEAERLYDTKPPTYELSHFDEWLAELDAKVPGEGALAERFNTYIESFEIPEDKLDIVFRTAIAEARKRTKAYITLPENENFVLEYVKGTPWGGYNYYQGNNQSLIQINTDFPIPIQRAIDLAAHEGYPGHHVYNVLLEQNLVKQQGWIEFSLLPLFSPQALIAEGSANYGIDVAFPGDSRTQYEKEVLFPLAGLDPNGAELYYEILALQSKLTYARNEAARGYLNGNLTAEETIEIISKYSLAPLEKATKSLGFIEKYRSYVINYNVGRDSVAQYMQREGATADNPERRWEVFFTLVSEPSTASSMSKTL